MRGEHWECVLPFDTDDPEFVRGVEVGRIYEMAQNNPDALIGQPFHASNTEMVMRIVESAGIRVRAEIADAVWSVLREDACA